MENSFAQTIWDLLNDETTAIALYQDMELRELVRETLAALPVISHSGAGRRSFIWCTALYAAVAKAHRVVAHDQKQAQDFLNNRLAPLAETVPIHEIEAFESFLRSLRYAARLNPHAAIELMELLSEEE